MIARRPLTDEERLDWLCLARGENVGPIAFRQLIERFGNAGAALDALPDIARRGGRSQPIRLFPRASAERELERVLELGGRILASAEPDYPEALAAIDDAPPVIAIRGNAAFLGKRVVAIVGARNASANGCRIAQDLARQLGAAGLVVVSGLARGIDAAAHRGSLATGTIAVVAGGLDVTYPREHESLQRDIGDQGVVIAEMPPGTQPLGRHFPRRNRIISGLALGVAVVEAARKSGSLITARLALDQGREVMAVPGSPLDPRCQGTNDLIRQGATLIQTAGDIIEIISETQPTHLAGGDLEYTVETPAEIPADARLRIERLLGPSPVAVDELLRQCQLAPPVVRTVLLELELAGRLERHPGNRVSLLVGP
jgi:DNA processing protein